MNTLNLKTQINGLTISTVKIGKVYETLVLDNLGNELKELTTKYKNEAEHNHLYCVAHYIIKQNCIHAI